MALGLTWMVAVATAVPAAAQTLPDGATAAAPPCQNIVGQAEIDGTLQQVTGLACQQPDGSWQFVQGDNSAVAFYPPYAYYDPWYWGGFVTVVGGSFVFFDRFHHRYPLHHVYFSRVGYGVHGWHAQGAVHGGWGGGRGGVWGGAGGMGGFGHGGGGGGHR
ncbi:hypothetical protein [Paraburkholderia sp. DHOC27]|uniref:hypothetical protein n=1 Tax=Paraburkholderia sp. DHOC27 TaxID=2303330 RepID=UPI0015F3037D|nr:hypothetical protein [Paraburkholderia sp. DHOC27]